MRAALLAVALLAAAAPAQTLVTGRAEYVDKGWTYTGWTGVDPGSWNAGPQEVKGGGQTPYFGFLSLAIGMFGDSSAAASIRCRR